MVRTSILATVDVWGIIGIHLLDADPNGKGKPFGQQPVESGHIVVNQHSG
ncbi:hypothetical protein [Mycobacterium paraintracellulare]|nr:hypothetical protein [Mycobacterium paraintracellulare]